MFDYIIHGNINEGKDYKTVVGTGADGFAVFGKVNIAGKGNVTDLKYVKSVIGNKYTDIHIINEIDIPNANKGAILNNGGVLSIDTVKNTELENNNIRNKRASEYPAIGDQLDALWKGGQAQIDMAAMVQAVKDSNPKV